MLILIGCMMLFIGNIAIRCFAASYAIALALELLQVLLGRRSLRIVSLIFGAAGLLAHTLYVIVHTVFYRELDVQPLSIADPQGSLLLLAWILAIFYIYGSAHYQRLAWGLFVLPIVLGLVILGVFFPSAPASGHEVDAIWVNILNLRGEKFWGMLHGCLLLLAAVGVCIGGIASIMYLVQVRRLQAKLAPAQGMKMLSLERIESMNRRAVLWAFPFLTVGLLVGVALGLHRGDFFQNWDLKTISGLGLWVVFFVLLYLRYSVHVRGRQVAWWTLFAFAIMVMAMVAPDHSYMSGDQP